MRPSREAAWLWPRIWHAELQLFRPLELLGPRCRDLDSIRKRVQWSAKSLPDHKRDANAQFIGLATRGANADGSGQIGTYGNTISTLASLPATTNFAGMQTTLSTTSSSGIGATYALILAGNNVSSQLTEQWRSRSNAELPTTHRTTGADGNLALYSDVVNMGNVTSGTAGTYVLQCLQPGRSRRQSGQCCRVRLQRFPVSRLPHQQRLLGQCRGRQRCHRLRCQDQADDELVHI